MRADDTQPEDIEGTAVDRAPQRRGDRRTHFTLVALALLSALFFAGALAYAVGGGLLSGDAPGDPSRAELPPQWSNLQPLEPIGPDSGGTGGSGEERGGATIVPGRLVDPARGPAFASTDAGI